MSLTKREMRREFDAMFLDSDPSDLEVIGLSQTRVTKSMRDLYFKANGSYGNDTEVYNWYIPDVFTLPKECDADTKEIEEKPSHYQIGIDTFERMRANATIEEAMGFIRWNIDKYNTRKKGQDISDYKKIKDYCDEAIWWLSNRS